MLLEATGDHQKSQSLLLRLFAQPPDRVGRRAVGIHCWPHFRISFDISVLIINHNFFERTRLLTNSGCQISWGRRFLGERRE